MIPQGREGVNLRATPSLAMRAGGTGGGVGGSPLGNIRFKRYLSCLYSSGFGIPQKRGKRHSAPPFTHHHGKHTRAS